MKQNGLLSARTAWCGIALVGTLLLLNATTSLAGGYSDYYSNRSQAEAASNRALYYGSSYGHAAETYMNRRYGYPSAGSSGSPAPARQQPLSEHDRQILERSRNLANGILSRHYGPASGAAPGSAWGTTPAAPTSPQPNASYPTSAPPRFSPQTQRLLNDIQRRFGAWQ